MSQNGRIIDYLTRHGSITQLDAMKDLGIMRLGARVFDLKERGYNIVTVMVEDLNRFGEPTRYARYYLKGDKE
jgi:hypothetical protein